MGGKNPKKKQTKRKQNNKKNQRQTDITWLCVWCKIDAYPYCTTTYFITGEKPISTHFLKQFHSLLVITQCIKIESKSSACIEFKPDLYSEIVFSVRPTDLWETESNERHSHKNTHKHAYTRVFTYTNIQHTKTKIIIKKNMCRSEKVKLVENTTKKIHISNKGTCL